VRTSTRDRIHLFGPLLMAILCVAFVASCSEGKPSSGRRAALTDRDFALQAEKVRKALGEGFIVEAQRPFVIAGNLSRSIFNRIRDGTILRAYHAFYRQFFRVRAPHVITIYLFDDERTYREYAKRLFGDEPDTHFGYYKSENHSLVMNIGTGTGTLVHEMTHALIEPDFPQVPAWFNEGLGSLFEQCMITSRGLQGLVNWRLPILRRAIEKKQLTGLRKLVSTTTGEFYRDEKGTHYAEARYFCMYMQEHGLLEKFYKEFRDNFKDDPTGARIIERLFGKSIEQVEQDWLKWVDTLPSYR
jgi:hypothetical protein